MELTTMLHLGHSIFELRSQLGPVSLTVARLLWQGIQYVGLHVGFRRGATGHLTVGLYQCRLLLFAMNCPVDELAAPTVVVVPCGHRPFPAEAQQSETPPMITTVSLTGREIQTFWV